MFRPLKFFPPHPAPEEGYSGVSSNGGFWFIQQRLEAAQEDLRNFRNRINGFHFKIKYRVG